MGEDDRTRILHIFDACVEILDFTRDLSDLEFDNNRMLQLAIVHLLEIIGEAAIPISQNLKEKYSEIPGKMLLE